MNVYELVAAIVLVITIGQIIRSRHGRSDRHRGGQQEAQQAHDAKTTERLRSMEERIEVLERIITDRGYELRQKFRDLER